MGARPPSAAVLRPQPGPQEAFLSTPADICIYGGGAGGGKTFGLLLEPLRHVGNPRFNAVVFRRTSPQIRNPGGLWDASMAVYPLLGAKPHQSVLEWVFRSGATLKFAHMQYEQNKLDWQGTEIVLLCFDELTHFSETQFFYMLSRNRSTCGVRPYVRATTNPDADSWVAAFIAWWIDQDTGFPIPERAGRLRYMTRRDGQLAWSDSPEDLVALCPGLDSRDIKSVTFVPATLEDNPVLVAKDPGYRANLMALPLVERQRLLGGNWKVRDAAGKLFNRGWFAVVGAAPAGGEDCRFWDFAGTEKKLKGPDPDYTAGVKIRKVKGAYYVLHCVAAQQGPAALETLFVNTTKQDAAASARSGAAYRARWELEGGSAAIRDNLRLVQMLAGFDARGVRPKGDKVTRAKGLAAQAEAGNVSLVEGEWNEAWLAHMHGQPDLPHDDIMDASDGAFEDLCGVTRMGWA